MKTINRFFLSATNIVSSPIGRDTVGSISIKIISTVLGFIISVLLARVLGPSEYGVYAYVLSLVSFLSVPSQFGLPQLVVRETAKGIAQKDLSHVKGVWRWSNKFVAFVSIGLVFLTGAFIFIFKNKLELDNINVLFWGLLLVPFIALGNIYGASIRGLGSVIVGQIPASVFRPLAFVILILLTFWINSGTTTADIAMLDYFSASVLAYFFGLFLLNRVSPQGIKEVSPRFENRLWLISAIPLAFNGGMRLINRQAAILLQGFFLNDADIGVFRVAMRISNLALFGQQAINVVLAPRFASLFVKKSLSRLQSLVTRGSQIGFLINLMITTIFIFMGKPFLRLVFWRTLSGSLFTCANSFGWSARKFEFWGCFCASQHDRS